MRIWWVFFSTCWTSQVAVWQNDRIKSSIDTKYYRLWHRLVNIWVLILVACTIKPFLNLPQSSVFTFNKVFIINREESVVPKYVQFSIPIHDAWFKVLQYWWLDLLECCRLTWDRMRKIRFACYVTLDIFNTIFN